VPGRDGPAVENSRGKKGRTLFGLALLFESWKKVSGEIAADFRHSNAIPDFDETFSSGEYLTRSHLKNGLYQKITVPVMLSLAKHPFYSNRLDSSLRFAPFRMTI